MFVKDVGRRKCTRAIGRMNGKNKTECQSIVKLIRNQTITVMESGVQNKIERKIKKIEHVTTDKRQ